MGDPIIKKATEFEKVRLKETKYGFERLLDAEIGDAYFLPGANVPYVRTSKTSWCRNRDIDLRITTGRDDGVIGAIVERIA